MKGKSHVGNRSIIHVYIVLVAVLIGFSSLSFSQDTEHTVPLGPFDVSVSLLLQYAKDDNLYQASDNEVGTSIYTVLPAIGLLFDNGVSGFSLDYALEDVMFSDVDGIDFIDQRANLAVGTLFGGLHRIEFSGSWVESHDRQTVADSPSNSDPNLSVVDRRLDYYNELDAQLLYTLGTERSLFNGSFAAGVFERGYYDNRSVTRDFDREEERFETGLIWNVSTTFRLGLSYADTNIEYKIPSPQRDGDERVSALTLFWEPVSSVEVGLGLGQTERRIDAGDSNTSDYWDASIRWLPLSYSIFTLTTSSSNDESSNDEASFILSETIGLSWSHEWNNRFSTEMSYTDVSIEYLGSRREDDSESVSVQAHYEIKTGVDFSLFYEAHERDSNSVEGYVQKIYGVSVLFQL